MKIAPVNKDGSFRTVTTKLAEALGEMPEDLFTERQYQPVPSNVRDFLIEEQHMAQLCAPDLEHGVALLEMADGIMERAKLSERQKQVLDMRFKQDMMYKDIAKELDVTQERVRQIEAKAMLKMRDPKVVKDILPEDVAGY